MTTPRFRSSVVGLTLTATLASIVMLTPAHARPLHSAGRVAHVVAHPRGSNADRDRMLTLVNRSRGLRGLPALRIDQRVSREALAHSRSMERQGAISHTPNLAAIIVRAGGTVFGENVGKGRGLRGIRDAWLRLSDTRRILLDPRFHHAGVGVIRADGFFWVTLQAFD
jgi:uncharacterized protein YkwD